MTLVDNSHELFQLVQRMLEGDTKVLHELRGQVVDLDLFDISKKADYKTLAVLYLTKKLIHDFYYDLATDASFEFPEKSKYAEEFPMNLAQFISFSLYDKKAGDPLDSLFKAIKSYYLCLQEVERTI